MTPEEAYEEALRRIQEVEETGALKLDLSALKEGKTIARPLHVQAAKQIESADKTDSTEVSH
jgi:hypothetical protein